MRTWRIRAALIAPKSGPDSADLAAQRFEFKSRFVSQTAEYGPVKLAIRHRSPDEPPHALYGGDPRLEVLSLFVEMQSQDITSALEEIGQILERAVDLMSFEMHAALRIGELHVLDVTQPMQVGDERECAMASGLTFDRNARSIDMTGTQVATYGILPGGLELQDSHTSAVLRWYVKALTSILHDQFLFLWIALEILCDMSGVSVEEPYTARCGHKISACPECGTPTTKQVRGRTIQLFLTEGFGVDKDRARGMWRMRQMMHGAIRFDSKELKDLPSLVQELRAVVAARIKQLLGKDADQLPLVARTGLAIHPEIVVTGTCAVSDDDLRPLTS